MTKLTSKFHETQNIKVLALNLSFPEHPKLLDLDKKRVTYGQINFRFLVSQPCSLLSGQRQTNVISTIETTKLGKAQNMKVIGYRISFPELQENLNSDLR